MIWINAAAAGAGPAGYLASSLTAWAGLAPGYRLLAASLAALILSKLLALAIGAAWSSPPATIARALILVLLIASAGVLASGNDRTAVWHAIFVSSPPVMVAVFGLTLGLALPSFLVADQLRAALVVAPSPAHRRRAAAAGGAKPNPVRSVGPQRGMEEAYLTRKILERTGDRDVAERLIARELAENAAPDRKTAIRYALYRLDDEERLAKEKPGTSPAGQPLHAPEPRPTQKPLEQPSGGRSDKSRLFRELRAKVLSEETAERLIAYEIGKRPGIDRIAAITAAIERLEWERSRD